MIRRVAGAAAVLALVLCQSVTPVRGTENEIVPEGSLLVALAYGVDSHERAISRRNRESPLLDYLVPDDSVREQIDGDIQRTTERLALRLHYGLSDSWNLTLEVPHLRITQESSLSASSAEATAEVERLSSRTISGLGELRATSLHRPLYGDQHGFVWGYGLLIPGEDPQSPYAGRGTLFLDSPFTRLLALVHYTYYPLLGRARFDLQAELRIPLEEKLATAAAASVGVKPGNRLGVAVGWEQELGPVATGVTLGHHSQSQSDVGGAKQGDKVQETWLRLKLGFGNLQALETGPLAFPFLLYVQYETTVQGYNTPIRSDARLVLQTYF